MTGDDSCSCTTFLPPNHVALTYTPKPIIPARRPTKRCNSVGPSVFRPRMPYAGLLAVILHLPRWSMVIHHRQHLHVVQNFKAHAPLYIISRRPYAMHPGRMRVRMIACISILVDTVVDVIMHTCEGVRHSGGASMRPAHLRTRYSKPTCGWGVWCAPEECREAQMGAELAWATVAACISASLNAASCTDTCRTSAAKG